MASEHDAARGPGGWAELVTTERCNQRCRFCYAQHRPDVPDPDLGQLRALFTEARAHTSRIILCGREALLRPDLLEVLALARELGLGVGVATNGQALARPGRVAEIAAAGVDQLQISYHFPDRASFAFWTQSDPSAHDRVLAGLRAVRDHNHAHPEQRVGVTTETELATFNAGRLAEIVATLREALGDSFTAMRLGALIPTPMPAGAPLDLLEPLEERRQELAALLPTLPAGLDFKLDKAPLCLLPGQEHLSLGVLYLAEGARLLDNHGGVQALADDVVAVSAATEVLEQLRANPYRAACRGCTLLPACRHRRTHWAHPAFAPTRAQKPMAVRDRTLRDVLLCATEIAPGAVEAALAGVPDPSALPPFPEEELLAAVRALPDPHVRLVDWFLDGAPILAVELEHGDRRLALRLEPAGLRDGPLGHVLGYLNVVAATGSPLPEAWLTDAARHLAGAPLPDLSAWQREVWFDAPAAALFRAAWHSLGPGLWPGQALGPWRNGGLRYDRAGGLVAVLRGDPGPVVEVTLGTAEGGLDLAELRRRWPGAPAAAAPAPGIGSPARLVVEFVPRAEPDAPHRFLVEVARPDRRYLLRRGGLGAWYREGDRFDAASRPFAALLGAALDHGQGHALDEGSVDAWDRLLNRALRAGRLEAEASVRVRWGAGPP